MALGPPNGALGALNGPLMPSYRLSVERRLGRDTWLALNGGLFYQHYDQPISSTSTTTPRPRDTLEVELAQESVLLGIRQVVARSVVDVSLYFALGFAHSKSSGDAPRPGEGVTSVPGDSSDAFGAVGGFMVERRLVDSLALRLGVDVIGATLNKRSDVTANFVTAEQTTTETTSQNVGLGLRPALQLQFYF